MIKEHLRRFLSRRGWFLRKVCGLPAGVDLERDWLALVGLPVPRIIFDVGAHKGETCKRFALSYPDAAIHSFEPVSANFSVLTDRASAYPHITCHPLACGAQSERVDILLQSDSQTHSLRHLAGDSTDRVETIQVITLDEFCATRDIPRIDLLKIDTEGHELAVLAGAHGMLSRGAIGPIFLEASLADDDHDHTALADATACLRPYGYHLAALYDQVMWPAPARLAYFNALFVPATRP